MLVLVTGGAGYLGSTLVPLLLQTGHSVRVLDNLTFGGESLVPVFGHERFELVRGDLRAKGCLQNAVAGMDAVVHLAAIVGDPACNRDPETAIAINEEASMELIGFAQAAGVARFVFASTCSNYGRVPESCLATEDDALHPLSVYARTKVAIEQHIGRNRGLPMKSTILRFATLYGLSPRMRFDLTVNEFVMRLATFQKLIVYGERLWRPYVHVRDAARAIAAVLAQSGTADESGVYNVGCTEENYRKIDILERIEDQLGPCAVTYVRTGGDTRDYRVSFERIRERFGFVVTRRVPDGVAEITRAVQMNLIPDLTSTRYYNSTN